MSYTISREELGDGIGLFEGVANTAPEALRMAWNAASRGIEATTIRDEQGQRYTVAEFEAAQQAGKLR